MHLKSTLLKGDEFRKGFTRPTPDFGNKGFIVDVSNCFNISI